MKKMCRICQMMIDTHTDQYCKLEDYDGKKKNSDGFYHKACFFERIRSKNSEKRIQEKAWGILDKISGKVDEVIEV